MGTITLKSIYSKFCYSGVLLLVFSLSAQLQAADKFEHSGFLKHYPDLKADPDFKGAYKWSNPKADLKKYNKLMVAPMEIWISPDSKYKGLSADQMSMINQTFQSIVREEMEPDFPLVSKPGKDVLVLRVAFTNLKLKKKKKSLTSWLPPSLILSGLDKAFNESLNSIELESAQLEGESRDAITNELVATRIVTGVGLRGKEMHFQGFIDFMRYRAKQFRATLD